MSDSDASASSFVPFYFGLYFSSSVPQLLITMTSGADIGGQSETRFIGDLDGVGSCGVLSRVRMGSNAWILCQSDGINRSAFLRT